MSCFWQFSVRHRAPWSGWSRVSGSASALLDWHIILAVVLFGVVAGILGLYIGALFLKLSALKPLGGRASMRARSGRHLAGGTAPFALGVPICLVILIGLALAGSAGASVLITIQVIAAALGLWALILFLIMYRRSGKNSATGGQSRLHFCLDFDSVGAVGDQNLRLPAFRCALHLDDADIARRRLYVRVKIFIWLHALLVAIFTSASGRVFASANRSAATWWCSVCQRAIPWTSSNGSSVCPETAHR